MCRLLLPWISGMGGEGMVESLTKDVLGMFREVSPDDAGEMRVRGIWHRSQVRLLGKHQPDFYQIGAGAQNVKSERRQMGRHQPAGFRTIRYNKGLEIQPSPHLALGGLPKLG